VSSFRKSKEFVKLEALFKFILSRFLFSNFDGIGLKVIVDPVVGLHKFFTAMVKCTLATPNNYRTLNDLLSSS